MKYGKSKAKKSSMKSGKGGKKMPFAGAVKHAKSCK